jgi:predicted enzyme related to lactoylglutathione lyase
MLPEGAICWVEHVSTDHPAAVSFYAGVLGLDAVDAASSFVFLRRGGLDIMAAYSMPGTRSWLPYFASADAGEAVERVRAGGGTVHRESTAVGDAGWSAWVADPEGTMLGIWQAGAHRGFLASGIAGSVCRVDLHTRRPEVVERFLGEAFGLERQAGASEGPIALAAPGASPVHLVAMDERWANASPAWVVYFGVPNVPQAVRAASDAGARVLLGARSAPGIGEFAVLADPLSVTFGLVQAPDAPSAP